MERVFLNGRNIRNAFDITSSHRMTVRDRAHERSIILINLHTMIRGFRTHDVLLPVQPEIRWRVKDKTNIYEKKNKKKYEHGAYICILSTKLK